MKYIEENILGERNDIERERKNLEMLDNKIQEDINILNRDKAIIEQDKEKMKNIYLEIEQKNNEINNEYKNLQRESMGLELKIKTVENMRLNHVLNNQNQNLNDYNDNLGFFGYNTSPNFGNFKNLNLKNFENTEKKNKDNSQSHFQNFSNTESIFNHGGKRINAEEYFKNLNDSLMDKRKRNLDNNEDMENYVMNGKNFVKDMRQKRNGLNDQNE